MKIKLGVIEKHQYEGLRELEIVDFEKFPIIKQFLDVNCFHLTEICKPRCLRAGWLKSMQS